MRIFYPLVGAMLLAGLVKTALVSSKVRLFKSSLTPDANTTRAELVAAESDFEGYAAKTVAAWQAPYFDPGGGVSIQSGLQQFNYVDASPHTSNNVGGAWVEDSTGALVAVIAFGAPIPMGQNGNAIPLDIVLNYGRSG